MTKKSKTAQAIINVWNRVHTGDQPKIVQLTPRELSTVLHIITAHQSGRRSMANYTECEEAILSAARGKLSAAMMEWWDKYEATFTAAATIPAPTDFKPWAE